jgi:hypothetical protein
MDITKPLSNIPIFQKNGEVIPGNRFHRVVLSSIRSNGANLVVGEIREPKRELDDVTYIQHVVVLNVGRPVIFEVTKVRGVCIVGVKSFCSLGSAWRPLVAQKATLISLRGAKLNTSKITTQHSSITKRL